MGSRTIREFEFNNTELAEIKSKTFNWFTQNQFSVVEQSDTFIKAQKGMGGPAGKQIFEVNFIKTQTTIVFHGEFYLKIRPKMFSPPVEVAFREKGFAGIKLKEGWRLTENLMTTLAQKGTVAPMVDTPVDNQNLVSYSNLNENNSQDIKFCTACGNQIKKGYKFCEKCGNKIE